MSKLLSVWVTYAVSFFLFFFFTDFTTLCGFGVSPWFRNSNFFWVGDGSRTPNPHPGGPGTALRLAPTL
jgi:hypothetical protein